MNRDMIILTKSKKYNNYCVAGKDIKTGEWIRLISDDKDIHNAIRPTDLVYEDNREADILDVVSVVVKEVMEIDKIFYQPENYILDDGYYLAYLGKENSEYLNNIIDKVELIFFNKFNCISTDDLWDIEQINSLLLIEPEIVKIKRKSEDTLWANIKHNNIWYNKLTITDIDFTNKYYENISPDFNGTNFYDFKLVISLGEELKGYNYKLIASIIEENANFAFEGI